MVGKPDARDFELLVAVAMETSPAIRIGARGVVPVTGGEFEGP